MESGGRFCVGAFGRNLASISVKMFSHVIYFMKKCYKFVLSTQFAKNKLYYRPIQKIISVNFDASYARLLQLMTYTLLKLIITERHVSQCVLRVKLNVKSRINNGVSSLRNEDCDTLDDMFQGRSVSVDSDTETGVNDKLKLGFIRIKP
jgi:hypothetical protein